eukprot:EG_transcript_7647
MQHALAEEVRCPVCLDLFEDPVVLACPHTVCRSCAAQQMSFQQTSTLCSATAATFPCPLCRQPTPLPHGVAALPRNHHLGNVADQLRRHGPPPATTAATAVTATTTAGLICGRCEQQAAACGCQTCGSLLCSPCRAAVHVGALARHPVTDVEAFQVAAEQAKLVCQEHKQPLKLYCPRCTQLVCFACGLFGLHQGHGCVPVEEAGLPVVEDMEGAVRALAAETGQWMVGLEQARAEVETAGQSNEAELKDLLAKVQDHTHQFLELLAQQQTLVEPLQQREPGLLARLPGAKAALPQRLEFHGLLRELVGDVQLLEMVPLPPVLRIGVTGASTLTPLPSPPKPGPLPGVYGIPIPVFRPDPVRGLQYGCADRLCRRANNAGGYVSAVAKEGLTAGQAQFTVHVLQPGAELLIGVAKAQAPRTGATICYQGVFLSHQSGYIHALKSPDPRYTDRGCFPAGCTVTMRLDFDAKTASYDVDGRDLGTVPCPLPQGPLLPAVIFKNSGAVQFVPALSARGPKRTALAAGADASSHATPPRPAKAARLGQGPRG